VPPQNNFVAERDPIESTLAVILHLLAVVLLVIIIIIDVFIIRWRRPRRPNHAVAIVVVPLAAS
jgi:hypothetical protein